MLNDMNHPKCNYCGIPSHKREICPHRIKDRREGLTRKMHPQRGQLLSKKEKAQATVASAAARQPMVQPISQQAAMPAFTVLNPEHQGLVAQYGSIDNFLTHMKSVAASQSVQVPVQHQPVSTARPLLQSHATGLQPMPCPFQPCSEVCYSPLELQQHVHSVHAIPQPAFAQANSQNALHMQGQRK